MNRIPEIEAPVISGQPEDTTLTQSPEVQTIVGASELTAPRSCLEAFRKQERLGAKHYDRSPGSRRFPKPAFSESSFDETTDRISGTRFLMMLQTGAQRAVFSKQGITISIPKNALPEGIQNEDQIEVIIQKDTGRRFFFFVFHQWNCAQLSPAGCICHAALSK